MGSTLTAASTSTSPLLTGRKTSNASTVDTSLSQLSTSTGLTTIPSSTSSTKSNRMPLEKLLMRDSSTQDPRHHEIQTVVRRRIKDYIFADINVDWKSIPVLDEETPFNNALLLAREDLRCKASKDYLHEVRDNLRRLRFSNNNLSPDDDSNCNVLIDDEDELVDMIG